MRPLSMRDLHEIVGGKLYNTRYDTGAEFSSVVSDSREVKPGCLFLCIKGENVDGHSFAKDAILGGAVGILAEKKVTNLKAPYIVVSSVLEATQTLAEYYRSSLNIKVVGVTGSVGKTSTKEFIAAILSQKYRVTKTRGNFNNHWGVPFTIFDINEDDQVAVVEMGISDFGEMDVLARIARPDIVVITNIGQSHMEFLKSRDGILKAKTEIFNYLNSDSHIILNIDDDKLVTIRDVKGIHPEFFGMSKDASVSAEGIIEKGFDGIAFDVVMRDKGGKMSFHVNMPILGTHMIYNALAAVQVGLDMNVPVLQIREALENVPKIDGRNKVIRTEQYTIIDDCYNASPSSMISSIDVLQHAKGRKVAILGDMLELGETSDKYHFRVGQYAGKSDTEVIICVGVQSEKMFMGAKLSSEAQIEYFRTLDEAMEMLPEILKDGDTVLVKASHSMNFNAIINMLTGQDNSSLESQDHISQEDEADGTMQQSEDSETDISQ